MRISADSPLIDIRLIKKAMKYVKENKKYKENINSISSRTRKRYR